MNTARFREVRGVMHYNAILRSTIDRSRARRSRRRGRATPSTAPTVRVAAPLDPESARARSRPHVVAARRRRSTRKVHARDRDLMSSRRVGVSAACDVQNARRARCSPRTRPSGRESKSQRCPSSAPSTTPTVRAPPPFDPGSGRARPRSLIVAAHRRFGRVRRPKRAARALFGPRPTSPERESKSPRCRSGAPSTAPAVEVLAPPDPGSARARLRYRIVATRALSERARRPLQSHTPPFPPTPTAPASRSSRLHHRRRHHHRQSINRGDPARICRTPSSTR